MGVCAGPTHKRHYSVPGGSGGANWKGAWPIMGWGRLNCISGCGPTAESGSGTNPPAPDPELLVLLLVFWNCSYELLRPPSLLLRSL